MYIDGSYRQPTFLIRVGLESNWLCFDSDFRRKWKGIRRGHITAFYLIWYGFGRMIIEGCGQIVLMFLALASFPMVIGYPYRTRYFYSYLSKSKESPYYLTEEENKC